MQVEPHPPVDDADAQVPTEPIYATEAGHIYKLSHPVDVDDGMADSTEMHTVKLEMTSDAKTLKQRIIVAVTGPLDTDRDLLFEKLSKIGDLMLVGNRGDTIIGIVRKRRGVNPLVAVDVPNLRFGTPDIPVGKASRSAIIRTFRAFVKACISYKANFDIYEVRKHDADILRNEWLKLTQAEIHMEIADAKNTDKDNRTSRQHTIVSCYSHVSASIREHRRQQCTMKVTVSDDGILKNRVLGIEVLKEELQRLLAVSVDADSGELIKISVWDWFFAGYYIKSALILYGLSGRGKSAAGISLCAASSRACQPSTEIDENYIIKAGTLDSLRTCCSAGLMVNGTAVLMDDVTPSKRRGTRPSMSVEDVKHMVMVDDIAQSADGRTTDIQFADQQARVMTSNAMTIQSWCHDLRNIEGMTAKERLDMDQDAMAVHRRSFFAFVGADVSLVPASVRKRFHEHRLSEAAAKASRLG